MAYHEVQIHIVCPQTLQTALNAFLNSMMPRIVQLRRQPYVFPWNTRVFDPLPHFMLIRVGERSIDVSVAFLKGNLDGVANLIGLALPGAKADGWDLIASIESKGFAMLMLGLAGIHSYWKQTTVRLRGWIGFTRSCLKRSWRFRKWSDADEAESVYQ